MVSKYYKKQEENEEISFTPSHLAYIVKHFWFQITT